MIHVAEDFAALELIAKHPKVFCWISDDYCCQDEFSFDESHLYLEIKTENKTAGFFMVRFESNSLAYIHTVVHPDYWGHSLDFAKDVIDWIFKNSQINVLATLIPENNLKAESLAKKSGMEKCGEIKKSFLKDGTYLSQSIYSICRGNLCQQRQQ